MAADDSSADEWSDDEFYGNIGDFDILELNENNRQRIENILQNYAVNPDHDTGDVDFINDYEVSQEFIWSNEYRVHCVMYCNPLCTRVTL